MPFGSNVTANLVTICVGLGIAFNGSIALYGSLGFADREFYFPGVIFGALEVCTALVLVANEIWEVPSVQAAIPAYFQWNGRGWILIVLSLSSIARETDSVTAAVASIIVAVGLIYILIGTSNALKFPYVLTQSAKAGDEAATEVLDEVLVEAYITSVRSPRWLLFQAITFSARSLNYTAACSWQTVISTVLRTSFIGSLAKERAYLMCLYASGVSVVVAAGTYSIITAYSIRIARADTEEDPDRRCALQLKAAFFGFYAHTFWDAATYMVAWAWAAAITTSLHSEKWTIVCMGFVTLCLTVLLVQFSAHCEIESFSEKKRLIGKDANTKEAQLAMLELMGVIGSGAMGWLVAACWHAAMIMPALTNKEGAWSMAAASGLLLPMIIFFLRDSELASSATASRLGVVFGHYVMVVLKSIASLCALFICTALEAEGHMSPSELLAHEGPHEGPHGGAPPPLPAAPPPVAPTPLMPHAVPPNLTMPAVQALALASLISILGLLLSLLSEWFLAHSRPSGTTDRGDSEMLARYNYWMSVEALGERIWAFACGRTWHNVALNCLKLLDHENSIRMVPALVYALSVSVASILVSVHVADNMRGLRRAKPSDTPPAASIRTNLLTPPGGAPVLESNRPSTYAHASFLSELGYHYDELREISSPPPPDVKQTEVSEGARAPQVPQPARSTPEEIWAAVSRRHQLARAPQGATEPSR